MDNLGSLSSNLPRHLTASQELANLDANLIAEFKTAACAVTKLYKLSGAKTALVRQQGYLDALKDLMGFLTERSNVSSDEVYAWALDKQQGLTEVEDAEEPAPPPKRQQPQPAQQPPASTTTTTTADQSSAQPIQASTQPASLPAAAPKTQTQGAFTFTAPQQMAVHTYGSPVVPTSFTGDIFSFSAEAPGNAAEGCQSESDVSDSEIISSCTKGKRRRNLRYVDAGHEKRGRFQ